MNRWLVVPGNRGSLESRIGQAVLVGAAAFNGAAALVTLVRADGATGGAAVSIACVAMAGMSGLLMVRGDGRRAAVLIALSLPACLAVLISPEALLHGAGGSILILPAIVLGLAGETLSLIVYGATSVVLLALVALLCQLAWTPLASSHAVLIAITVGLVLVMRRLVHQLRAAQAQLLAVTMELRQAKEAAEHANQVTSAFLDMTSHELRSPLNVVINGAGILSSQRHGPLNDRQQDTLRRVERNAADLLRLVNDILDLSKIQADRLELRGEWVDMREVIRNALDVFAFTAADKGLRLSMDVGEVPPIWGDKFRLQQVLLNLVSNAVKFTAHGGVVVRCALRDGRLVTDVEDTGIGIAAEHHALIFEEFRQVEVGLSRAYGGTGLGLPIIKRLVDLHGGQVRVLSAIGQGSTFRVVLPVEPVLDVPLPDVDPVPVDLARER